MFGCKEICLECCVKECMTLNCGGKLCPASRLAPTQKHMNSGDRELDSGGRWWIHTPQKCCLTLAEAGTASIPASQTSKDSSSYQHLEVVV